jgi:hypothetical protein
MEAISCTYIDVSERYRNIPVQSERGMTDNVCKGGIPSVRNSNDDNRKD